MGFLEGNDPTGELQQGEVVLGLLRPANEQGAVTVEPGVTGFDNPAAGTPVRVAQALLHLLAAAGDMRDKPRAGEQIATDAVVVAGIEAETLGYRERRLWSCDRDRGKGGLQEQVVVAIGAGVGQSDGDTGSVGKD